MDKKAIVAGVLLLAVGGVALAAMRRGALIVEAGATGPESWDQSTPGWVQTIDQWTAQAYAEIGADSMTTQNTPQASTNIAAMQETIAQAEGTAQTGDPYRVCYGYSHTIQSFADHPAILGEWSGVRLSDSQCAGAGLGPGCVSTAAGKYQITRTTWRRIKAKLGLPDFSPASQDAACVELLRERGALRPLEDGRFADAVYAARKEWASLAGAGYGQGERSIEWLTAQFQAAGGVLA